MKRSLSKYKLKTIDDKMYQHATLASSCKTFSVTSDCMISITDFGPKLLTQLGVSTKWRWTTELVHPQRRQLIDRFGVEICDHILPLFDDTPSGGTSSWILPVVSACTFGTWNVKQKWLEWRGFCYSTIPNLNQKKSLFFFILIKSYAAKHIISLEIYLIQRRLNFCAFNKII